MNSALKKITAILILIILLPVIFFSVYEISTLNKNETMLKAVYEKQLDAMLYSVNQYSDDIVSSWRSNINLQLYQNKNAASVKSAVDSILNLNSAIQFLFFADSINAKAFNLQISKTDSIDTDELKNVFKNSNEKLSRLFTYKRGSFFKIEPVQTQLKNDFTLLLFLINDPNSKFNIAGIVIDPQKFVTENLSQKIQSVAENQFVVTVNNKNTGTQIYSTEKENIDYVQQKKLLWLLPNYYLGINLKSKTVEELVNERSATNLILIIVLAVMLIIAALIIFFNIKKEIQLSQLKADFVSNVSHEIKTPLALISMFAETLEKGRVKTEEKKNEYYSIIIQETNRLGKIVNKILNFSKMEAGKRFYNLSEKKLNEVVENVYSTYKFHLHNNGFEFLFMPEPNLPQVKLDDEAVSEAIINLIDNAVKYSSEKKQIKIITGSGGNFVFVTVEDKGIGISATDKKKVFDKFYRVSSGDVYNSKGTGLGLTIVKQIMDAHKGKIELSSEPGKGSAFKLIFYVEQK